MISIQKLILILSSSVILFSCAGPSSPFGADLIPNKIKTSNKMNRDLANYSFMETFKDKVVIKSYPQEKRYHTNFDLSFTVENKNGLRKPFQYNILYNGNIINNWLKNETIVFNKLKTKATITFSNINLRPELKNDISFLYYDRENHAPLYYDLKQPECSLSKYIPMDEIHSFTEKNYLISKLNEIARNRDINPTLLASLVAQESSFNPKAVSIARAVGLTQVTPIANDDIRNIDPSFVSYPNTNKISYLDLKYKIFRGIINEKNDWRLNEVKSLSGGAIYLNQLKTYWENDNNQIFLKNHLTNYTNTDIVLASYNSGASRVRRNIIKHKKKWLSSNELGEAKKYVYNIKSYCNDFKDRK